MNAECIEKVDGMYIKGGHPLYLTDWLIVIVLVAWPSQQVGIRHNAGEIPESHSVSFQISPLVFLNNMPSFSPQSHFLLFFLRWCS